MPIRLTQTPTASSGAASQFEDLLIDRVRREADDPEGVQQGRLGAKLQTLDLHLIYAPANPLIGRALSSRAKILNSGQVSLFEGPKNLIHIGQPVEISGWESTMAMLSKLLGE